MNATPPASTGCSVSRCPNAARTRGLCNGHYKRLRKHGDVQADVPIQREPVKATCTIADCGRNVLASGWCARHYSAWRKHGDPLHERPKILCGVAACERPARVRGLCEGHWGRLKVHGDVRADIPFQKKRRGCIEPCSIDGCVRRIHARDLCGKHYQEVWIADIKLNPCVIPDCPRPRTSKEHGWCGAHYSRWQAYGDPLDGPPMRKLRVPDSGPSLNTIEYRANHQRVRRERGPAWQQACAHCGARAREWATIHGRSGESPDDFMPLCKPDHARYDGAARPVLLGEAHPNAKLTEAAVRDIRTRGRQRGLFPVLARQYGVTPQSIANAAYFRTWKHVA